MNDIERKLSAALQEFQDNVNSNYETTRSNACSPEDLHELAKQTYYVLSAFRDEIVKLSK